MKDYAVSLSDNKMIIYAIDLNDIARPILKVNSFTEFIKRHKEYYLFNNMNEEDAQIYRYIKYFYPESFI